MASTEGIERAVETNQKHLIKKILARYPSQWTFFRELVQNADDACAKEVVIEFETDAETKLVKRTTVSNDGNLFSSEDWGRLTSIASGNPAVDKIGFFGVGFYCVFSLSDAPCVSSGKKRLDFFWKGNSLYTRETQQEQADNWTRFYLPVLDISNSTPPPEFEEIGGFLAELLCFTRHIRSVRVLCDNVLQVTANRTDEFSVPLRFPSILVHEGDDSLIGMFNRTLARSAPVKFVAKKNASSVSRTKLTMIRHHVGKPPEESAISFIRGLATFHTQLSEFSARAYFDMTQKSHPQTVQLSILTTLDRKPAKSGAKPAEMFLYNKLSPMGCKGHVFIGFITSQTVGSVHVGGPFVPTMERENLDFATPIAKEWNLSLFNAMGTLARVLHDNIALNPETFFVAKPLDASVPATRTKVEGDENSLSAGGGGSFWLSAMKKATSLFTAFASDNPILMSVDEEKDDDDALFASLEEQTGAVVVSSMAVFAPMFSECRPYAGVGPQIWRGFLAKEFDDGPMVWTAQGRSVSSDKARVFPPADADLPQLSSVETFPVVPIQVSRTRPVGFRSFGGLASAFLEKLKEDKQLAAFDLSDILSELQKRPLRGLQETLAFVEWFFRPVPVQFVTVRCGNCGAHTRIRSNVTEFTCQSCRFRLTYHNPSNVGGTFPFAGSGSREAQLRGALKNCVRCVMEDGTEFKLASWKYKLDPKLEPHLPLVKQTLSSQIFEQICPYEISKRAAVELQLEEFNLEKWMTIFFPTSGPVSQGDQVDVDHVWRILFMLWKRFANNFEGKDLVSRLAASTLCIPTTNPKQILGAPKFVYTTELEEPHEDVLVLAPLPSAWMPKDDQKGFLRFLVAEMGVRESVSPTIIVNAFAKGKLPRQELWRFLHERIVDFKEQIEPEVVSILSKLKCLPKAVPGTVGGSTSFAASDESFMPSTLYMSTPALLDLNDSDVPVLFFEDDALIPFLQTRLGVRKSPPNDLLLRIASSEKRTKETRLKALVLFVTSVSVEDHLFDFSAINVPIVPCIDGTWATPRECYLEVPRFLQGSELKTSALANVALAKKLGVKPLPSPSRTVSFLETQCAERGNELDPLIVDEVLDHLAARQLQDLSEQDSARLGQLAIIAIPSTCMLRDFGKFAQPRACFFEPAGEGAEGEGDLRLLFCFVPREMWDRSARHRTLLQGLGVREAPTLSELAEQLATNPKESLSRLGTENYLNLLRSIASDFGKLRPQARAKLQTSPCLLARTALSNDGGQSNSEAGERSWQLYLPNDIVIEDDSRYRRLFNQVPSCPLEISLEQMYLRLGAMPISQVVTEQCSIRSEMAEYTNEARLMDRRLCERIPVLIQKLQPGELNKDKVKLWMDAASTRRRQVDEALTSNGALVMHVPEVKCELKLTMRKRTLVRSVTSTACILRNRLFITKQIDFFHVASALVAEFCSARSNDRALLWATLLQSTTQSLEEMGFVLPKDPVVVIPPVKKRGLLADEPVTAPSAAGMSTEGMLSNNNNNDNIAKTVTHPPARPLAAAAPPLPPPLNHPSAGNSQVNKKSAPAPPPSVPMDLKDLKLPAPVVAKPSPSTDLTPLKPQRPTSTTPSPPIAVPPLTSAVTSMFPGLFGGGGPGNAEGTGRRVRADPNRLRDEAIQAAINKCRASEAGSDGRIVSPATKTPMSEPMLDCTEPHELVQDTGIGSIECFVQRGSIVEKPFELHMDRGREFANLLVQMSIEIFGLDCSVVHMYWDERGTSRAFNRGGSLFFNLHSWVLDNDSIKSSATWKRWFGTMCHELTHNLHAQHDAQFANFLELFCVEFSDRFLSSMKVRGLG